VNRITTKTVKITTAQMIRISPEFIELAACVIELVGVDELLGIGMKVICVVPVTVCCFNRK